MNTFLIGYDLNKSGKDYQTLIESIKELSGGTWWHHLDSTWLIKSDLTAVQVRDILAGHIDSDDELLIINVTGDGWASRGLKDSANTWLKNNM